MDVLRFGSAKKILPFLPKYVTVGQIKDVADQLTQRLCDTCVTRGGGRNRRTANA
jgi:hypothetical protein